MSFKKIGVDFHGVINRQPQFFKALLKEAFRLGLEVHIISGGPRETIEEFLSSHQMPYSNIWCIFDYFNQQKAVTFLADGSFHVDDKAWDAAKADYCRHHGINVQIDDSLVYGQYFTTPYCRYDARSQNGEIRGKQINFSLPAAEVLQNIITICSSSD